MSNSNKQDAVTRNPILRQEDRMLRDKIQQYKMLFELGQIITSEMNFDSLFKVTMEQTNQFMNTEQ